MATNSTPSRANSAVHFQWSGVDGAPVVALIHGSLDRMAGMTRVARELDTVAHVLRYDRRGYGKSWPHDGPFTVADQVRDLELLLQGRRAVVVGHSFGGNVALAFAATNPGSALGVSTYETPLSWLEWWPGSTAGAATLEGDDSDAAERFMRRLIGDRRWEELPDKTKQQRRREGVALRGELRALREKAPWSPTDIGCRVISGHGELGRDHHRMSAKWLCENIPTAEKVCLSGAAHDAPTRNPQDFVRLLVMPHLVGHTPRQTDGVAGR